jgi:hypothetical protein
MSITSSGLYLHVSLELLDKQRISQNEVLEGLQVVDVEVLRFLNDLLIECGPNRREAAIRLANCLSCVSGCVIWYPARVVA